MNIHSNPKLILSIDAIGAAVSATLLGLVLTQFETEFGMPKNTLYVLAIIPCLFLIYDVLGFTLNPSKVSKWIKGIAWLNIAYCMLSIIMIIYHRNDLTILGWIYFIGELAIVLFLANVELKLAKYEIS
ncbi:MAG: hypothetical protein JXQ87_05005 [Bacteroidia bacterium]